MPAIAKGKGKLILVSGPSGAGKDAVIDGAHRRLAGDPDTVFPLRTISRPEGFGGEIHVAVTPAQFDRLRRRGAFAFCWGAGGLNYAVPASIESDLAAGRTVIVNVASAVFAEARARYPGSLIVWVTAPPELRRKRLLARGRETAAEIDERFRFAEELPPYEDVEILANDGSLDTAVNAFLSLVADSLDRPPAKRDFSRAAASSRL